MPRNPFSELERVFDEMSDRFEEARAEFGGEIATAAIDVAEWDGEYLVIADMPGYEAEDIDVDVADDHVHISAEHEAEHEPEVEHYYRRERARTSVSRTVRLPGEVDESATSASYEDGVLTVTLPKKREEEMEGGRHIEIE